MGAEHVSHFLLDTVDARPTHAETSPFGALKTLVLTALVLLPIQAQIVLLVIVDHAKRDQARPAGIRGLVAKIVNSYRFLDGIVRPVMKHWATLGAPCEIPWSPLAKPLSQCTVAIVSSAAVALKTDQPFDQEIERRDPWFSDPSYRVLPRATTAGEVRVYHLHINASFAQQDLNCVMPLERLSQLEA
jgi:hypothetical protein